MLVLFIIARRAKPAHNQRGTQLSSQYRNQIDSNAKAFSLATYNIQTGKSLNGVRNINASAAVLKDVDIAGVQEVYATGWLNRLGLGISQTQALAQIGGFAYLFCATRRRWLREHRGNALLSKLAVSDWRIHMLPDKSGKSYRNMTVASVHWQGEVFHLINTHLHTREGREQQLAVVLAEFAKYPRAILMGDFNTTADDGLLASALADKTVEMVDAIRVAGLDLHNPERIDWILTKGFRVQAGRMLDKGVSDHPYYQVTLAYEP